MAAKDTLATLHALKIAQEKAESKDEALEMLNRLIESVEKNK